MVPTSVLLASVSSYALAAGAFYTLTAQLGHCITGATREVGDLRQDVSHRFDRVEIRLDRAPDTLTGVRAGLAGVDARLSTLEDRLYTWALTDGVAGSA